jgi:hypothetical protein
MAANGTVFERETELAAARAWERSAPDWEAPAGGAASRPRLDVPTYRYHGDADPHWSGQRCEPLDSLHQDSRSVLFACGCRAAVPTAALERIG